MDKTSKRLQKLNERDLRVETMYRQHPEIKEIDEAIAANGHAMLRSVTGAFSEDQRAQLQAQQKRLLDKQQALLKQAGYDSAVYEPAWNCPLCQDRGYIEPGRKCRCTLREEALEKQQHSGLAPLQLAQTFDNFSLEWYEEPQKYERILSVARHFAKQAAQGGYAGNLLLYGTIGTGKTHLCSAIANEVLAAGGNVVYTKTSRLFSWLRSQMYSDNEGPREQDPLESLFQADLLILDDLGTEKRTDFVEEQLFNLIDERIIRRKSWIISTNFSVEKLLNHYDERLTDRILGEARRLRFDDVSIRRQKIQKSNGN
jgi:DNA replication protein DnaC